MIYDEVNGRQTAARWKVARSTLSYWKRTGRIPDHRAAGEPLDEADKAIEEKLIKLIESGWLKAKPISRLISRQDKVNALLKARRYPNDPRYRVRQLRQDEIGQIKLFFDAFTQALDTLLFFAGRTPSGELYSEVTQAELRLVLHRPELDTVNVRLGRTSSEIARFWAFMRGQPARREDLDVVLTRLSALVDLLR